MSSATDHPKFLQHHYDTPDQQFDTAKFGMWVFIATEILMFGGLFVAYLIFKGLEPSVFLAAHHRLDRVMGAANTVVLLFSSLTAALAVRSSQLGKKNATTMWLAITRSSPSAVPAARCTRRWTSRGWRGFS